MKLFPISVDKRVKAEVIRMLNLPVRLFPAFLQMIRTATIILNFNNDFIKIPVAIFLIFLFLTQIAFAEAIRIMPLGDSITYDQYLSPDVRPTNLRTGYRQELWLMLQEKGYSVNFVGNEQAGEAAVPAFDPDNEGHPGWRDDEIAAEVYGWLQDNRADIILLHVGTNQVDPSPADVKRILDEIDLYEKDYGVSITIFLARIINRAGHECPNASTTTTFNINVTTMAIDRVSNPANGAYPDKIFMVDMECGADLDYGLDTTSPYDYGDMYDLLHPNVNGYEKMAKKWFQRLLEVLPTARAGGDKNDVNPGDTVTLNGSDSSDSLGKITIYAWAETPNQTVKLDGDNKKVASFTAPSILGGTTLIFKLTITDDKGFSHSDECKVIVNGPPIAAVGADQVVNTGAIVILDGTGSTDPGGAVQSYQWQQTAGSPTVNLSGANTATATFTAPPVGSGGVDLAFKLSVTDNHGAQDEDTCNVHVNGPPVADAGADQQVRAGAVVVLDGTRSSDADGSIAVYRWAQAGGSPAVGLIGADTPRATFTAPDVGNGVVILTFQLTVTDNLGVQNVDSAVVQIRERPTANAGPDQEVETESIVVLDGSGSAGAVNGVLSFAWVQTSGPLVSLSSSVAAKPVFSAPSGIKTDVTLTFLLTVTDTGGLQSTDSCTVTVIPEDSSSGSGGGGGGGGCFITTAGDRGTKSSFRDRF